MIQLVEPHVPVITVDGASGTGKGTISLLLAGYLKWNLLDSGALYRVLGLAAKKHGISLEDENHLDETSLERLAEHLDVQFIPQKDNFSQIILEGENVSETIRTELIGRYASVVAQLPAVRAALLSRQRAFREQPGLVADGRDMGTVIFPDAELKIFLLASPQVRAERRYHQLKEQNNHVTLSALIEDLRERDKRDQERLVAPLKPAEDAVCIETDSLTITQVVERILCEIESKKAFPAILCQETEFLKARVAE